MTNHLSIPTDTEESSASNALTGSSSNSPGLISYFVNVISGARQTASQEFGRFWENLEHHHHNIPTTTTTTTTPTSTSTATDSAATTRSIRTPRSSVKNINDTSRLNKGEHINGRIIPDHYRRGYIKDAEIQTENFEVSIPSSTVHKRKASGSLSSNYTYWTELERPLKKQARSVSPPAPSIKEKESSTIGSLLENKDDSSLSPGTREVPWTYSLSANTSPIHRRYFQTRPATASPERRKETTDVMTGSKSVRRLTHELESNFIPRSPMSPYLRAMASPRQQQDKSADREPTKMDLSNDSPNDTTSSSTTRMEDIFPMIKPQPSNESPIKQQQRLTAKELDERMEKLEKEVGITKTKVKKKKKKKKKYDLKEYHYN
jgi:hypothetical protein